MGRLKRRLLIAVVGLALFYMMGGPGVMRTLQARWRASLAPPEQLPAPVAAIVPLRATLPREAVRGKMWLSDPPRAASIVVVLTTILFGAVTAMYVTGRPPRRA